MYEYKATIVKVVDGDSIYVDIDLGFDVWIRNQSIRLYGIDTPECRQRDKAKKAHGLLAKAYVQRLSSWEEHMRSQQKRKESLEDFWASSKREKDLLRNSLSKNDWRFRTLGKIKRK